MQGGCFKVHIMAHKQLISSEDETCGLMLGWEEKEAKEVIHGSFQEARMPTTTGMIAAVAMVVRPSQSHTLLCLSA